MATKTNNLKLSKAENSDAILSTLESNNKNFDKLDEVIMRLRRNQLSGEVSGTEIVVQDSAEMESILHISGNSEQDSRSGKNILAQESFKTAQTINGVTFTPNADGSIKISGTATAAIRLDLTYKLLDELVAGKTYISSVGQTVSDVRIKVEEAKGGNWAANITGNINTPWVFNGLTAGDKVRASISISNGTTVDTTIYPQIEEGSTATSYEPYGLKPSPDFESPIMSVKSKSDNLFDSDYSLVTKGGFVKQSDGSYYLASVNQVSSIWENTEGYTGQFSLSLECKWDNDNNGRGEVLQIHYTDGTMTDFMTDAAKGNKKWGSFKCITEKGKIVQKISTTWGNSRKNYFRKVMLNKGPTDLSYQPYGHVPAEAKVEGKNLVKQVNNYANTTVVDGVCTQTHTDTKTDMQWKLQAYQDWTLVKQLTIAVKNSLGVHSFTFVKDSSFNKLIFGLNGSVKDNLVVFITDDLEDGETYTIQWNILTKVQGSISWNNIQINRGATLEPYTPYKEIKTISLPLGDIELRSTPDGTRDTFTRVDEVWNKVSKVGCGVLNGAETWEGTTGYYTRVFDSLVGVVPSSTKLTGLSNYFKVYGFNHVEDKNLYFHPNSKALHIRNPENIYYATMQEWKDWLSAHPTEVIYPLATPTYTPITDQGLISALDELEELILNKGYNHITVTAVNGVKAYLDLTYVKDINLVLNNLTAQIASVGGAS